MILNAIIIFLAHALFTIGTYVIWPSRWNVAAHLQLGLLVSAFLIPLFFTDVLAQSSPQAVQMIVYLCLFGAPAYLVGLVLGDAMQRRVPMFNGLSRAILRIDAFPAITRHRIIIVLVVGIAGMAVSFGVMGVIPAFAENPLSAKFGRGQYEEVYRRMAVPFRFSYSALTTIIPIAFLLFLRTRNKLGLVLSMAATGMIALQLTRAPAAQGILLAIGIIVAQYRRLFCLYLVLIAFAAPLGSISFYLLGQVTESSQFNRAYSEGSIADLIASGTPDVRDQTLFITNFKYDPEWTYGRTFVGGLVPFHYEWNPNIYALRIISTADISEVVSGGLRLPPTIWGYVSFGWAGAVLVPFFSGLINGIFTRFTRKVTAQGGMMPKIVVLVIYMTLFSQLVAFYRLTFFTIPEVAVLLFLLRQPPRNRCLSSRRIATSGRTGQDPP